MGLRYTWKEKDYEGGTGDTNPFGLSVLLADFSDRQMEAMMDQVDGLLCSEDG